MIPRLAAHGLHLEDTRENEELMQSILLDSGQQARIQFTHGALGFKELDGELVFLARHPIGCSNPQKEKSLYTGDIEIDAAGSLDGYIGLLQKEVVGHTPLELALAISYTPLILFFLRRSGYLSDLPIFAFVGPSSTGKTLALRLIASAYGSPTERDGLIGDFNSTDFAIPARFAGLVGMPLILDEATDASYDFKRNALTLSKGRDRNRCNPDGSLKRATRFVGSIIVTSEKSVLTDELNVSGASARVVEFRLPSWTDDADHAMRLERKLIAEHGTAVVPFAESALRYSSAFPNFFEHELRLLREAKFADNAVEGRKLKALALVLTAATFVRVALGIELDKERLRKLSRFSRNASDHMKYEAELKKLGIECVSITENFADTPLGRHEKRVQASHNQLVSEETGEHTFSGMQERAKQGFHCGGRPPLGYKVIDKRLVIDEDNAEAVRLIFQMTLQGISYSKMAAYLNKQGYRTHEGREFNKNSFNSILHQEKYCGTYVWNKTATVKGDTGKSHTMKPEDEQTRIEGGCPAIIDRDTFDKVQKAMRQRSGGNRAHYHYMLAGMGVLKCAHCGHTMYGAVCTKHDGTKYTVYACPNHHGGDRSCPTKDVRTDYLDGFVGKALIARRFLKSDTPDLSKQVAFGDEIRRLQKRQRELKGAIETDLSLLEKRYSDTLEARYFQHESELERLSAKIDKLSAAKSPITTDNIGKVIGKFKKYLITSDDPAVRSYLMEHIDVIQYGNDRVSIHVNTGQEKDSA